MKPRIRISSAAPAPFVLAAVALAAALSGCGYTEYWQVAAAFELSAIRLDPATGEALGPETAIGRLNPPRGSSYLWWSGADSAGSTSGGVALLRLGSCERDYARGENYYREAGGLEAAVVSTASADALVAAPGSGSRSLSGGTRVVVATGGGNFIAGAGGAFEPAALSFDRRGWAAAAFWEDGGQSGLACAFDLHSSPTLSFFGGSGRLDLDDYEAFAGSYLGVEGGASLIGPFFSYALDRATGRTLKQITLLRLDASAGAAAVLGSFPVDDPASFRCVEATSAGLYRILDGSLALVAPSGTEIGRSSLSYVEAASRAIAGPLAGSGILFAPEPAGDSRWSDSAGASASQLTLSLRRADLALAWTVELPDPDRFVVAAMKLPDAIVALRAKAVSPTLVQNFVGGSF